MSYSEITGIILIICVIIIFLIVLNRLPVKTKCKIAKVLKEKGPYLFTAVGIWQIIDFMINFPTKIDEISMLFNASKSFHEISHDSQISIIALILISLAIALWLIGSKLYKHWKCWELFETKEV